jgi:hypothetical protein
VEASGIPYMTFHDLRHVNASMMAVLNIPDKYAQERGGWRSDHIMKSVYQQTFSADRADVDDRIDNYMMDVVSCDNADIRYREKYRAWLTLFDREESETSERAFKKFLKENNIE